MNEYKCYFTSYGCMGHVGSGKYQLFATESDYMDWYYDR